MNAVNCRPNEGQKWDSQQKRLEDIISMHLIVREISHTDLKSLPINSQVPSIMCSKHPNSNCKVPPTICFELSLIIYL